MWFTASKVGAELISLAVQTDTFLVDERSPIHHLVPDVAPTCVLLSGALDQYQAESLKEQLLNASAVPREERQRLSVDMTAVDHLDASCLQVLLAVTLTKKEEKLILKQAAPAVRQWIRTAGADELFDFCGDSD